MNCLAILLAAPLLAGCVTKHFGRMPELEERNRYNMTVAQLDGEIAKAQTFKNHVLEDTDDGRNAWALVFDLGIGNEWERNAAIKSADLRIEQCKDAQRSKLAAKANE